VKVVEVALFKKVHFSAWAFFAKSQVSDAFVFDKFLEKSGFREASIANILCS
jgi:hypothetical protein